jgi:hypothetical protein
MTPGQRIDIEVPIEGNVQLFYARASTFSSNPPCAEIIGSSLHIVFNIQHDAQERDIKHESGFRYVFHHSADNNREFLLTVMVFDVAGPN